MVTPLSLRAWASRMMPIGVTCRVPSGRGVVTVHRCRAAQKGRKSGSDNRWRLMGTVSAIGPETPGVTGKTLGSVCKGAHLGKNVRNPTNCERSQIGRAHV